MQLEPIQELILDFIEKTNRPIFLTGKAGTGKTTFLRHIRTTTHKNLAVVAPTAVAAINAGGVTIHSFFQVPFGPIPPGSQNEFSAKSFSQDKAKLIKCLDLLIIDEISMVRADTMDYIDRALKHIKGSSLPFGGVQLLMIGDLYQLPPVFQNDWHLLSAFYKGPYFFDSQVFKQTKLLTFELNKVHRQNDPSFIAILNEVRNGKVSAQKLEELNKQYHKDQSTLNLNDHVTLTTHNPLVKEINEQRLNQLPGALHRFRASVTGDFPAEGYPTEEELVLKEGAMIMFIKNDSSGEKKFYNGRTATIQSIKGDNITVNFLDDQSTFEVSKETWENTKYSLADDDQKVTASSAGSFMQYPIRLAWAITIHKSQGLTFDKAVVDVGAAFAHGQTYVALSRCRSLAGLVLKQQIQASNIITDTAVVRFMESAQQEVLSSIDLKQAIDDNETQLLQSFFDLAPIVTAHEQLKQVFLALLPDEQLIKEKFAETTQMITQKIYAVAHKFSTKELSNKVTANLSERINKASAYFLPLLTQLHDNISLLHQMTAGVPYHPDYFPALNQTIELVEVKIAIFKHLSEKIDIEAIQATIKEKVAGYKNIDGWKKKTSPIVIENPKLYAKLSDWRKATADYKKVLSYHIISDQALAEISAKLPRSLIALAKIKNVGEGKATTYGEELLKLVRSHTGEGGLFG